jgi:preprotein translocase subunit YajC
MAAPGAEGGGSSIVPTLITFGLVFVIFYFLIIRPQNKKKKDTENMLKALKKGDRVVSIGGIHGTIQSAKEDKLVLKLEGSDTKMTFSRSAISNVVEQSKPTKRVEEAEPESADEESDSDTDSDN